MTWPAFEYIQLYNVYSCTILFRAQYFTSWKYMTLSFGVHFLYSPADHIRIWRQRPGHLHINMPGHSKISSTQLNSTLTFLWASAANPDFVARLLAIAVLSTTNTTRPSKQQRTRLSARSHWQCQLTKPRRPPSTFKVLSFPFKVTWSWWRSLIGREWCHADVATTTDGWNVYGKVS